MISGKAASVTQELKSGLLLIHSIRVTWAALVFSKLGGTEELQRIRAGL